MVNGHNLSPKEQKEVAELWDTLYHHYTLAEFYDDLEAHPWSSGYNSSEAIDKIIEYNGAEFQNLYDEYSAWAQDVEGDVMKPKRPGEDDDGIYTD